MTVNDESKSLKVDLTQNQLKGRLWNEQVRNPGLEYFARFSRFTVHPTAGLADFNDIQEALDAVNLLGGGIIYLKNATYTLSSNLTVYANTSIIGESSANTIIDFDSNTNYINLNSAAENILLRDFATKNSLHATIGAINLDNNLRITIDSLVFEGNTNSYDITGDSCGLLEIIRCNSTSSGGFTNFDNMNKISIVSGNYLNANTGIVFKGRTTGSGAGQVVYEKNFINDIRNKVVEGKFSFSSFMNNTIDDAGNGSPEDALDFESSEDVFIIGNHISVDQNGMSVIKLDGGQHHFIANNFLQGDRDGLTTGILVSGINDAVINGNFIICGGSGVSQNAVQIQNNSNRTKVIGNSIQSSLGTGTAYAVAIQDANCDDNVIVGNWLNGDTADILDNGTNTTAGNNN